jgi:pimeloyl-ACP methyl ester carboxylesterase
VDSFLPGVVPAVKALSSAAGNGQENDAKTGNWFSLPQGRHIVIAACRPEQSAREKLMPNGQLHGVLSYYLLDTLQQASPALTYRDVFSRTSNLTRSLVKDQNPLLAATDSDDLRQPFLGGAIVAQKPYAILEHQEGRGWVLKAGAVHGIDQPKGDETTLLAIFPLETSLEVGSPIQGEIAQAKVVEVGAAESRVEIEEQGASELDPLQVYKAVVISTPLPAVAVYLSGDDQVALDLVRKELQASTLVRISDEPSEADIRITADQPNDSYLLARAGDREPLNVKVPGKGSNDSARIAAARAEHIAQWLQILNLENKHSQIPPDAVRMEIYQYDREKKEGQLLDSAGSIRLTYDPQQGENAAAFQLRIFHAGVDVYPGKLYCMLCDLTDDFAIFTDASLFGGGVWLEPGQEVWGTSAEGEKFIDAYVPDEIQNAGVHQIRDVLKLIVSTDESDAILLQQDGLEVVQSQQTRGLEASRKVVPPSTLDRLMQRVHTRAVGRNPRRDKLSDWRTSQVLLTTIAQSAGIEVPTQPGESAKLAEGVTVAAHSEFQARVQLLPFQEGKRDLGNLALPAVFRDHPELAQPFNFQPARGGDAGSSVVLLSNVTNPEAVTSQAPLIIRAEGTLAENEAILPVAYDTESGLFLPLGLGTREKDSVEIRINRLPAPTADSRDVAGSIKLFIQKVLAEKVGAQKLGLDGRTTRLAVGAVEDQGRVTYDDSPIALKEKVKNANRILLYIHGIFGDTRGMVASAYGLKEQPSVPIPLLADSYDLILAFDYENINTPIGETASKLKQALVEAGLGPDHGKTLHIVAHSMGTMVTRWFVERDNGHKFVQKALLVAPPNAGTAWAKIEDFILVGLGAALNGLAAIAWPPSVIPTLIGTLTGLVGGVEKIDVTMDELKPDSTFYRLLNTSDDPGVKYIVIAGNTSKISHIQPETAQAEKGLFKKLVDRLTSPETRNRVLSLAFLNEPNDIAISVKSMISMPSDRNPAPDFVEIPCDHISYFSTEVGLGRIVKALLEE